MARIIFKTSFQGSTLVETIVALGLLSAFVCLTLLIISNIGYKNSFAVRVVASRNVMQVLNKSCQYRDFEEDDIFFERYVIKKKMIPTNFSDEIYIMDVSAIDSNSFVITRKRILVNTSIK